MNLSSVHRDLTQINKVFWAGLTEGKILVQTCLTCKKNQFYPRIFCKRCQSIDLEWREVSLTGELYSYTIIHRSPSKEFFSDEPYVLGIVKIHDDNGSAVEFFCELVDIDHSDLFVGMKLQAIFPKEGDTHVLAFTKSN